jgi:hypothetical protein
MIAEAAAATPPDVGASRDWIDANQLYLSAEFARITVLLQRASGEDAPEDDRRQAQHDVARVRLELQDAAAIDRLCAGFGLTPFERDVLLLTAGVEMESALARRCAEINGHLGAAYATFAIALGAFANAHWSALAPEGPLRESRLLSVSADAPLTSAALRIDERVLHYLAGLRGLDPRLSSVVHAPAPVSLLTGGHTEIAHVIARSWTSDPSARTPIQLYGEDGDGQEDVASQAALDAGLFLHVLRAEDLPPAPADRAALAALWNRDAVLLGSALLVQAGPEVSQRQLADFVARLRGPVIVSAPAAFALHSQPRRFRVDRPGPLEQRQLWHAALGDAAAHAQEAIDIVASQCRLSARSIAQAGGALAGDVEAFEGVGDFIKAAQREIGHAELDDLAQRVEPTSTWTDIVLPEIQLAALREIATQVRHRTTIHEVWGFSRASARGLGISALFAGESGTGKTMAAEVLAGELGLELYRIDLSSVVSKYIGETEKNLRRVFDAADGSGSILLFDEADALFGKRSEVKDSHDRYANIEVSYLLQRMEAYRGLAILTTNAKPALDRSFQRRLRFVVHFPFPDAAHRERIWQAVFPPAAPTANLDFAKLARPQLSGGSIRNIALVAAFRAVAAGTPVTMAALAGATRAEFAKADRALPLAETKDWA